MAEKIVEMGIREIWSQCRYAEIAYQNIQDKSQADVAVTFSSIHSFLSHCALVSKLLWSKALSKNSSNKTLADILLVDGSSKVAERIFRDKLEHYDQYLKKWIDENGPNIGVLDNNIGPKNFFNVSHAIRVRHYDPTTCIYTLIDEDLNLQDMYLEIIDIKEKADQWVKRNC